VDLVDFVDLVDRVDGVDGGRGLRRRFDYGRHRGRALRFLTLPAVAKA